MMPILIEERIRIGVSACNAGARVGWNRAGWDRIAAIRREMTGFIWTPVRPEVMSVFGVPRDPVRLSGGNGHDLWQGTARMKNRSGVYRTTLKNKRLGNPPGVFGSLLLQEDLFLIPAVDLESPIKWWDWRRRLHAFTNDFPERPRKNGNLQL
jgi:hypothetical protein